MDQQNAKSETSASAASISVVVPVFNSAATLGQLVRELKTALSEITTDFEIILVNDGSKDLSSRVIADIAKNDSYINAIQLSKNYGQQNALLCGVRAATKKIVVTIDDDLQNPPSEIFKLLHELEKGHDVVYGVRERQSHGILREISSRLTRLILQKAMGVEVARNISNFRAFRTHLREAFANYSDSSVCLDVILTWSTNRFSTTTVKHSPRSEGSSNYTLKKLITLAVNLLTGYTVFPLQLASLCGLCFLFLGIIATTYVLANFITHPGSPFPDFAFMGCAIFLLSATQLLALGVIGEYLARIHARSMGKPPYMVRDNESTDDTADTVLIPIGTDNNNA